MEEIKVTKLDKGFAVKFPYELKDGFRKKFPSAKWDPREKYWKVGSRSGEKLEAWLEDKDKYLDWVRVMREQDRKKREEDCIKEAAALSAVQQDGMALRNFRCGLFGRSALARETEQSEAVKLAAVQQNGLALQFVDFNEQSEALCLAAVQQNGFALQFVFPRVMNESIYLAAVQQDGLALQHVPLYEASEAVNLAAVQQNGEALAFIRAEEQSEAVKLAAAQQLAEQAKQK